MKLKIDYEYDEAHISSILKVFLPLVDRIMKTVERGQDISLQRAALMHEAQTSTAHYTEPYEEEDSESDEDSNEGDVIASIPRPKAVPPIEKSPPLGKSKGRDVLYSLVKAWEVNFNQDGEQPDRLKLLGDITKDRKKIGPFLQHCTIVGSLTVAVHDVRQEQQESPDAMDSRVIAANICQIASCVCPPIADHFKYPNPLAKEKK